MNLHDHNCGFKCFKRTVLKELKIYDDLHRFITVFVNSKGYKVGEIEVEHHERVYGKSKYGFTRYFIGFKDIIRVKFIISHKNYYSFIMDILIFVIFLVPLFIINDISYLSIFVLLILIYCILICSLNKYKKFNTNLNKYFDIM